MKRTGSLFDRIVDRENLRQAFYRASRGKRRRPDVEAFAANLEANLRHMACEIESGSSPVGRYQQFTIHDPKRRVITAPCFPERVLHHAIMNVCEPYFERFLIADTFACRHGKGRIAALHRAVQFSGRYAVAMKLDMRKYFDSVSHHILFEKLSQRFKDHRLLALFRLIIESHGATAGRGLPIGSLTSQHFANFYLGWFDRFVKQQLRVRGYVRYMDDCVLWADDRPTLATCDTQSRGFLRAELDLQSKTLSIVTVRHGFDFLGCRVYPDHLKLNQRSRRRFRRKLLDLDGEFASGGLSSPELQQRVTSLVAFTRAGGAKSWKFRRKVLQRIAVSGHRARTG
jgi:hypothetical protein